MLNFIYARLDFILFSYSLLFFLAAKYSFINSKLDKDNDLWRFLMFFCFFYGLRIILDVASLGGYGFYTAQDIISGVAFLSLIEYARANTKPLYTSKYWKWNTLFLALFSLILLIAFGAKYFEVFVRYGFCLFGSIWVVTVLILQSKNRKLFYGIALSLSILALVHFLRLSKEVDDIWIHKEITSLILLFFGISSSALLLIMVNMYLNLNSTLLGVVRRNYLRYAAVLILMLATWSLTENLFLKQQRNLEQHLIERAKTVAAAIDPVTINVLTFSVDDELKPDFQKIKQHFLEVRKFNSDVRFIYLMGLKKDKVLFYLDSEDKKSPDYALPGSTWNEAPSVIKTVYLQAMALVAAPYTDHWGTWKSAFVPIKDLGTNDVIAIMGMDVDIKLWNLEIMQSRLLGLVIGLFVFLCLLVFFAIYELGMITAETVKKSEEKFYLAFERSPVLTSISTLEEGRFIDVNETFCNVLGYSSKQEVIGRTSIELRIFRDIEERMQLINNIKEDGYVDNFDMHIFTKTGEPIMAIYYGSIIPVSGKKCLLSVIEDVTKRKYDEALLKEKTDELERFFNVALDILCIADTKGYFRRMSKASESLLGYKPEEMENMRFIDFVHPDDIDATVNATQTLANNSKITSFINRYRCKDGSYKWLEWYSTPYDGKVIYAAARDITMRKKASEALEESEQKYRSVVDNIGIGISVLDRDMRIISINHKMREYFPNLDITSKPVCYASYNNPARTAPCTYCPVLKTFADGDVHTEITDTPLGDQIIHFRITSSPIKDANGNVVSVIELTEDITEQMRLQNVVKDNEQYLRTMWDSLQAGVAVVDAETFNVVDVNPAALRILKAKREDVVGHNCGEHICSSDCQMCPVVMKGKEVKNRETYFKDPYGNVIPVLKTVERIEIKGKTYLLENFIEIGKLKEAQKKLEESESRFRDIATSMADWVWEANNEGIYTYCSGNVYNALGYHQDEIVGKRVLDFTDPEDWEKIKVSIAEANMKKQPFKDMESRRIRKDGVRILVSASGSPILDKDGNILGYRGIEQDITEKKRTEEYIRQLSQAVEQSPATIVITDIEGGIQYINSKFTTLTGYTMEEAKGQNPRILKAGDMPVEHYKTLWSTIKAGYEWRGELHNKKKNGEFYWESASISPIKDSAGNTTHFLAVKEDITERKKLEAALQDSQDALLRASKIKDEFLAITSHDLKSPLGIVKTSMSLLLDEKEVGPSVKEYAELSLRQANKGLKLIADLLDLKKLETGDVKLETTRFVFSRLVEEILQDFRKSYEQAGVSLLSYSEGEYEVTADYNKVGQLISNLLGNALKYTSRGGGVKINTSLTQKQDLDNVTRDYLKVIVTDTGSGIPEEKIKKVFEKYEQANYADRKTGTGIGLAIAKYVCELHHGDIWVESKMGQGSSFIFILPYNKEVQEVYFNDDSTLPYKILIVDDMSDQRFTARVLLKKSNFHCDEATNWRDALDKIRSNNFSLVLLDVEMPDLNGYELLEIIRREKTQAELPVIMFSSRPADDGLCKKLGVSCFVNKDLAVNDLVAAVKRTLGII